MWKLFIDSEIWRAIIMTY